MIEIKKVDWNSDEYMTALEIRNQELRKPLGLSFSQNDIDDEKNQHHFVLFQNHKICGTVILKPLFNIKSYKLRQMAVAINYQGVGLGRYLVLRAEDFAIDEGVSLIELHARLHVKEFYSKLDYLPQGNIFTEVGIDHIKMTKELL